MQPGVSIVALDPNSCLMSPPPAWKQRFRSDDLDEVREFVGRFGGEHSRVAHRPGPLAFELDWMNGEAVATAWARIGLDTTLRGAAPDATLHVTMPSGASYQVGRRRHVVHGATAIFLAPGWEFTRRSGPGSFFAISIDGRRLAEEVAARAPERRDGTQFMTRSFELAGIERAALAASVREFMQTKLTGSERFGAPGTEAGLIATVAGLLLRERAVVRVDPVAAARIADVEGWIESRLVEPITIGRLCELAGVGERRLQKAFEARRGVSPMRFVMERRLSEARRRLKRGGTRDDVTSIALGLGFRHMGRFALEYRKAFGESPSQTRRKAP